VARKRKIESEKRNQRLPVQMTLDELQDVRTNAKEAGLSVSEFVRRRTSGRPTIPRTEAKIDAQVLSDLNSIRVAMGSGVFNNLNQLVKDWNSGRDPRFDWRDVLEHVELTLQEIDNTIATVAESYE